MQICHIFSQKYRLLPFRLTLWLLLNCAVPGALSNHQHNNCLTRAPPSLGKNVKMCGRNGEFPPFSSFDLRRVHAGTLRYKSALATLRCMDLCIFPFIRVEPPESAEGIHHSHQHQRHTFRARELCESLQANYNLFYLIHFLNSGRRPKSGSNVREKVASRSG